MIKFSDKELNIICDALNTYYGRQHDAAQCLCGRLSKTAQSVLEDDLRSIEDLYDRIWGYLSEEAE